jgi:hypothetical protein
MERFDVKMQPSPDGEWIRYSDIKQEGAISVGELIKQLQKFPPDLLLSWNIGQIER